MIRGGKKIADAITLGRAGIGAGLIAIGWFFGAAALSRVACLMLVNWIGDVLDGAMARRNPEETHSWIGDHDLEVDIFVSACLAVYLWLAGLLPFYHLSVYLIFWLVLFFVTGFNRSLGMLFQAPVYLFLIVETMQADPSTGWMLIITLAAIIILTWPRFPNQVIPGFLRGIEETFRRFNNQ